MSLKSQLDDPIWLFPFEGMSVGDSFFVPSVKPSHLIYIIDTRAKAADIRIKAYTSVKDGCLGVRVWRIN